MASDPPRFIGLQLAFTMLRVCLLGGLLVIIAAVVNLLIGKQKGQHERVIQSWLSMAIALIPVFVMAYQISKATGVPPIHNISTDTENPPEFYKVVELRGSDSNPLAYGDEKVTREQLVEAQTQAYPKVRSIHTELSATESFDRAVEILRRHGHVIVNEDRGRGIIEAVDTTFWFGFKDDLVVRILSREGHLHFF